MTEECTWSVVQFIDDHTVEAVPTAWIQGDQCHWPSFSADKRVNAIRKSEPLNTCWPSYQIKVFRNATFSDYIKARNKAKVAEETSDLASEAESAVKRKRKMKKKVFSSSSDDEISNIPTPPPLMKVTNSRAQMQTGKENSLPNVASKAPVTQKSGSNKIQPLVGPAASCAACLEQDKNLKTIIEQNHLLRCMVQDVLAEIKNLKEEMKGHSASLPTQTSLFNKFPNIQFPLNSEDQLQTFHEILKNEEIFNEWVNELAKMGGANTYHFVKRILHSLITNDLALEYSLLGRKQKKPFCETGLARLIICASELTKGFQDRKETESCIQSWLRRAGDRKLYKRTKKL